MSAIGTKRTFGADVIKSPLIDCRQPLFPDAGRRGLPAGRNIVLLHVALEVLECLLQRFHLSSDGEARRQGRIQPADDGRFGLVVDDKDAVRKALAEAAVIGVG